MTYSGSGYPGGELPAEDERLHIPPKPKHRLVTLRLWSLYASVLAIAFAAVLVGIGIGISLDSGPNDACHDAISLMTRPGAWDPVADEAKADALVATCLGR